MYQEPPKASGRTGLPLRPMVTGLIEASGDEAVMTGFLFYEQGAATATSERAPSGRTTPCGRIDADGLGGGRRSLEDDDFGSTSIRRRGQTVQIPCQENGPHAGNGTRPKRAPGEEIRGNGAIIKAATDQRADGELRGSPRGPAEHHGLRQRSRCPAFRSGRVLRISPQRRAFRRIPFPWRCGKARSSPKKREKSSPRSPASCATVPMRSPSRWCSGRRARSG